MEIHGRCCWPFYPDLLLFACHLIPFRSPQRWRVSAVYIGKGCKNSERNLTLFLAIVAAINIRKSGVVATFISKLRHSGLKNHTPPWLDPLGRTRSRIFKRISDVLVISVAISCKWYVFWLTFRFGAWFLIRLCGMKFSLELFRFILLYRLSFILKLSRSTFELEFLW